MGQEIESTQFSGEDFRRFGERLQQETALLAQWFREERLDRRAPVGGYELEAWLVDADGEPAPVNEEVLGRLDPDQFTSELARFNVELNNSPAALSGDFLEHMARALEESWRAGQASAHQSGARLAMIGILPTLEQRHLNQAAMTPLNRYAAINEQILRQRGGRPLCVDIRGKDHLQARHQDVMLESATTSFQIHTQVPLDRALRYYNASILVSAPLVAAAANSPFMFGKELWPETRIPLFEQSVEVGGYDGASGGPLHRVGFGSGFARHSLLECFTENLEHFPVLLPMVMDAAPESLAHLRLHNGTIWRWNRPLIGVDQDPPHLRIEHRVLPGGPSIPDLVANAALYFGLAHYYSESPEAPERQLGFARARDNFYAAARHGLDAVVHWPGQDPAPLWRLLPDLLLPCARQGLLDLGLRPSQIHHYLDLLEERVRSRRTGAHWQCAAAAARGGALRDMTLAYLDLQASGRPVHEWPL